MSTHTKTQIRDTTIVSTALALAAIVFYAIAGKDIAIFLVGMALGNAGLGLYRAYRIHQRDKQHFCNWE